MLDQLLDIIFPKVCLSCHKEGHYVCPACFAKIPIQKSIRCYICGKRVPDGKTCPSCKKKSGSKLSGLLIASEWNNMLVRQMIYEFKYRFIQELSIPLAEILIFFLNNNFMNYYFDKITNKKTFLLPVPLHPRRLSWRGFNQAELLANKLTEYFKIPIERDTLARSRNTLPQMEIKNYDKRKNNISDAFRIAQKNHDSNDSYILVDDICTTASTFENCALALQPLRPKEIWGLALARG